MSSDFIDVNRDTTLARCALLYGTKSTLQNSHVATVVPNVHATMDATTYGRSTRSGQERTVRLIILTQQLTQKRGVQKLCRDRGQKMVKFLAFHSLLRAKISRGSI